MKSLSQRYKDLKEKYEELKRKDDITQQMFHMQVVINDCLILRMRKMEYMLEDLGEIFDTFDGAIDKVSGIDFGRRFKFDK